MPPCLLKTGPRDNADLFFGDDFTKMGVGGGTIDVLVAEFGGFFEAFVLKGNGADFTKEAEFAKTDGAIGEGAVFDTTDDGEGDGQIDTRFVDGQSSGDIDENIFSSEGEFEMFG